MKVNFMNLSRQYEKLAPEIEANVMECLKSCAYIEGPMVKKLEKELAGYLGVKHVITCGNGTDSLILALLACGVKNGDEVITTPFSFFATSESISAVGAVPVFADVKSDDFNIDPSRIEEKITSRTKAILPVHIFGTAADMDAINEIAKRHNLKVIEDACQAIGSAYKGKKTGTLGDLGCFSFYPTKNLAAAGDAGMITTNDDDLATACRAFKAHGAGKGGAKAFEIINGSKVRMENVAQSDDPLYDPYKYYNFIIGRNSRLDSLQAAVLLAKLPHIDEFNRARCAIANKYNTALAGTPLTLPTGNCLNGPSCWHQYAVLAPDKEAFANHLSQNGIGSGAFYPVPLHLQKVYTSAGIGKEGDCPVAEHVCKHSVCLPVFPELRADEQQYIIDTIMDFFK
jgi:dTDP-4-amino-4,6-dideoxygalactose transaminase